MWELEAKKAPTLVRSHASLEEGEPHTHLVKETVPILQKIIIQSTV